MPPRKKEEWITSKEAAALLTENSGHEVKQAYVRFLAIRSGKIAYRAIDGRTNEYLKSDVEAYRVRERQKMQPRLPAVDKEAA